MTHTIYNKKNAENEMNARLAKKILPQFTNRK